MSWEARTRTVLEAVLEERARQVAEYGHNEDIEDGTGPETRWVQPFSGLSAEAIEYGFRQDYLDFEIEVGKPTWVHLVREEVAEAFQETDPERLEAELVQVAALCVSWVEKLQMRRGAPLLEDDIDISELDLYVRSTNALRRNGIHTIQELCEMSYGDLERIKGMGFKSMDDITARLQMRGLGLRIP